MEINGERVSCTGRQLSIILNALGALGDNYAWFAADVSANEKLPPALSLQDTALFRVGDIREFKEACGQVEQYLTGVFLAVPSAGENTLWRCAFNTEDPPFRDLGKAVLEIRAFDTTYFEVYAVERSLLEPLASRFNVPIEDRVWKKSLRQPPQPTIATRSAPGAATGAGIGDAFVDAKRTHVAEIGPLAGALAGAASATLDAGDNSGQVVPAGSWAGGNDTVQPGIGYVFPQGLPTPSDLINQGIQQLNQWYAQQYYLSNQPPALTPEMQAALCGIAAEIASGHAYDDHVVADGQFPEVKSQQDFQDLVQGILLHPSDYTPLPRGRSGYYDSGTGTIVIRDPNNPDGGTAFRPPPSEARKRWRDLKNSK
jgi:hypothetical protein